MAKTPEAGYPDPVATFMARYHAHFERWAHNRIPAWARPRLDTRQVVSETFAAVASDITDDAPSDGLLLDRVRRSLYERVLHRVQQVARDIAAEAADVTKVLPLRDAQVEQDLLQRYEHGLQRLPPRDRDAIIARTELALPWTETAHLLDTAQPDATRATVSRALVRLAREMAHECP